MVSALYTSSPVQSVKKAGAGHLKLFSGILNNIILGPIIMWPEVAAITTNAVSSKVNILSVGLCCLNALGELDFFFFN